MTDAPPYALVSKSSQTKLCAVTAKAPAVSLSEPEKEIEYGEEDSVVVPFTSAISISKEIDAGDVAAWRLFEYSDWVKSP